MTKMMKCIASNGHEDMPCRSPSRKGVCPHCCKCGQETAFGSPGLLGLLQLQRAIFLKITSFGKVTCITD